MRVAEARGFQAEAGPVSLTGSRTQPLAGDH